MALHKIAVAPEQQFEVDTACRMRRGTLNDEKSFAPERLADEPLEILDTDVRQPIGRLAWHDLDRLLTEQPVTTAATNEGKERCDQGKAKKGIAEQPGS